MTNEFKNIEKNLKETSAIAPDVKKWEIKDTLRKISFNIEQSTKEFIEVDTLS